MASKAGVIGLTEALALELGPKGITVDTIPPGFIDTPMLRTSERRGLLGEGVDHHAALTPVRRVGRPDDIAAYSFLVRDEASYVRPGDRRQRRPQHLRSAAGAWFSFVTKVTASSERSILSRSPRIRSSGSTL